MRIRGCGRRLRRIVEEHATGGAVEIVKLTRPERPKERDETKPAHSERDRDQKEQPAHARRPNRSELTTTRIDEHDIAAAATIGVTNPAIANGTTARL